MLCVLGPTADPLVRLHVFQAHEWNLGDDVGRFDQVVEIECANPPCGPNRDQPVVEIDNVDSVRFQTEDRAECLREGPRPRRAR